MSAAPPVPRTPHRQALLDAVESVRAVISANADEAEAQRRQPMGTIRALSDAGLFALMAPERVGGYAADPLTVLEVIEALSAIDGSAGWTVMIGANAARGAATFTDDAVLGKIFQGNRMPYVAGSIKPEGRGRREPGGLRVSGRYTFGSGIHHAEWVIATCIAENDERIGFIVPQSDVRVIDNWDVVGLSGTGSCDYELDGVFIPEEFLLRFEKFAGAPPLFPADEHAGVALGIARHALDEIAKLASEKRRLLMPGTLADRAVFHRDLGRAYLELRATRALMFETLGEFWRSWSDTRKIADEVRLEAHAAAVRATEVALDAATLAFRYAGGASVYRSHPLQRCLRDLNTAAQHRFVGDDCWELLGSQLLDRKSLWSR